MYTTCARLWWGRSTYPTARGRARPLSMRSAPRTSRNHTDPRARGRRSHSTHMWTRLYIYPLSSSNMAGMSAVWIYNMILLFNKLLITLSYKYNQFARPKINVIEVNKNKLIDRSVLIIFHWNMYNLTTLNI